jgi:P-type Cu+ transporter
MKKITLTVSDMHCVNCAMTLQSLEDDLPGVKTVEASYRSGKMVVEFDEAILDEAKIIAAVKGLGYTAAV